MFTLDGIIQKESRIKAKTQEGRGLIQTEITRQGDYGATITDGTRQRLSDW